MKLNQIFSVCSRVFGQHFNHSQDADIKKTYFFFQILNYVKLRLRQIYPLDRETCADKMST